MKRSLCVAALLFSVCMFAVLPGDSVEAGTYDSPFGYYEYLTHGSGNEGNPYWSNITLFDYTEEYVTIQSALEGYRMTEISGNSFRNCVGMTDLILPATLERIGAEAFSMCESLERIYFLGDKPDIDNSAIPAGIEIYRLSGTDGWNSSTNILESYVYSGDGYSFDYYAIDGKVTVNSLIGGEDIVIPSTLPVDGDNVAVTTIGNNAFHDSPVFSVTIPDTVTLISVRAFYGCYDLETVVVPSTIKVICDEAFRECRSLANVNLHNVEYIGFEAFRMCYSFTEVIIPDSVNVMCEGAFRVCTSMVYLTIGSGITDISDSAFDYCQSLEDINIRGKIRSVGENAFFNSMNSMPKLEKISLPYVEYIGNNAFSGCISLKEVIIGDNLREIGASAFSNCRSLETVYLPAALEKVGDRAFQNNRELTDIYFDGKMPEFGDYVFSGSNVTVHCTESNKDSWKDFDGNLVIDSVERSYDVPAALIAVVSAILLTALFSVFAFRRNRA